ncbi:MAG: hypothetical protein AB8U25_02745 [Rickettsiales endosymbiont of Dermacentor nuttalli]
MSIDSIGSNFVMQNMIQNFINLQNDYIQKQLAVSSTKQSNNYAQLADKDQSNILIELQNNINKFTDYNDNNATIMKKLNTMHKALSNIQTIAQTTKALLTRRESFNAPAIHLEEDLRSSLALIMDNLNTTLGDEHLFAGGRTNITPVNDIVYTSNIIGDKLSANYYSGDDFTLQIQASDSLNIQYGIKANDPAFQTLIGALHTAIQGDKEDDRAIRRSASDMLDKATQDVNNLISTLGNQMRNLDNISKTNTDINFYYNQIVNGIVYTDIPSTMIEINNDLTALISSYSLLNKYSHLSLADYLR